MPRLRRTSSIFGLAVLTSLLLVIMHTGWTTRYIAASRDTSEISGDQLPPLCAALQARHPDSIPPIVHWTSRDGRIPAKLVDKVLSWRKLLVAVNDSDQAGKTAVDDWLFMHWDDRQIQELIGKHYPLLNRSYVKLANGLERSDIGRLVVLHHVGGIYVDTDVELLKDLSPLLRPSRLLLGNDSSQESCCSAIWAQEPVEHALFVFNLPRLISNAISLSRANHSFLTYVLDTWPKWFEANWGKRSQRWFNEAVKVTGPAMLQAKFDEYMALKPEQRPADWSSTVLVEPDLFQPRYDQQNQAKPIRKICSAANRTQLGELKWRRCQHLFKREFNNRALTQRSYTVHDYLHLSYTNSMDLTKARNISTLLPISRCRI